MNLGKPTKVSKLNEQMAIELGASLMGEVIIFSVAGGCLLLEYNRQVAKEMKKEEIRQQQLQKFTDDIKSLNEVKDKLVGEVDYLKLALAEFAKKSKFKLPEQKINSDANNNLDKEKQMNSS